MNWYLLVKYLHIVAVAITIGGMFARQLVRGFAKRSADIKTVASLTPVAIRIDRTMVIPWSNIIFLVGIVLALMQQWPIFGFLQGAAQNWLLISNILLIMMLALMAVPARACRTSANDSTSTIIFMVRRLLDLALRQAVWTGLVLWLKRAR